MDRAWRVIGAVLLICAAGLVFLLAIDKITIKWSDPKPSAKVLLTTKEKEVPRIEKARARFVSDANAYRKDQQSLLPDYKRLAGLPKKECVDEHTQVQDLAAVREALSVSAMDAWRCQEALTPVPSGSNTDTGVGVPLSSLPTDVCEDKNMDMFENAVRELGLASTRYLTAQRTFITCALKATTPAPAASVAAK